MNTEISIERFIVEEIMLGNHRTRIDPDQFLIASGVVDSLGLIRLIHFIEEEFGLTIEDSELIPDNFQTINHIKAFIEGKRRSL